MQLTPDSLKTWDLLGLLSLLLTAVLVPAFIIYSEIQDSKERQAFAQVEQVAELLEQNGEVVNSQIEAPRLPASSSASDPWGQTLRYEVLSSPHTPELRLAVWSAGANGVFESRRLDPHLGFEFGGDDIGTVRSLVRTESSPDQF